MEQECEKRRAALEKEAPIDAKGVWMRIGNRVYLCGTIGVSFDIWQRRLAALSGADAYFSQQIGLDAVEREMDRLEAATSEASTSIQTPKKIQIIQIILMIIEIIKKTLDFV